MRPTIPLAATRHMLVPFEIDGYTIEPQTVIAVNAYGLHHDPALYPEPERMQPERFLGEGPAPYSFLPFGGGAHRCLGEGLALLEIKIALSEIVRRIYDPGLNTFGTRGGGPQNEFVGGARDGARLPATQRLDLSVTRTYSVRGTTIAPYVSVVNAYYAKNVFMYVFDYTASPPTKEAISQFPLLPSAGVSIRF